MAKTGRVAAGCKKPADHVIRDPKYKYFTPKEFYEKETFPNYFSGAGYVFNRAFAQNVASVRDQVPGNC